MSILKLTPKLFRVETNSGSNTCTWDLLTIDGENPRNTVYFLHKEASPSHNQSDELVKAIENEEWEEKSIQESEIEDYSIDLSIFDSAGVAYSVIKQKLEELIGQ